uniref:protein ALP1-like n=1 Tax=Erigeron canadensis TaxID=72917 RepID=UPI001CB8B077|nr:protein ALP1-like [Erigeron canadensis]
MDSDDSSGSSNGHDDYEDRVQNVILRAAELLGRRIADQPAPVINQRVPVDRNRIEAHARLMHDYFDDQLRYNARLFRKRFRMTKKLFLRIVGDLEASIDCMHWPWEMCPAAWRGTYTSGHVGRPSLILQAVASNDLRMWNAYFGQQGSHNDINVFEASPILEEIINGLAPSVPFSANGNHYEKGYYLGDDIYPEYATFVKTFSDPIDEKRRLFKKKQEWARKGIERAFGVLKKRWKVLKHLALYWNKKAIQDVCYVCIILHNMILEDEGKAVCQNYNDQ